MRTAMHDCRRVHSSRPCRLGWPSINPFSLYTSVSLQPNVAQVGHQRGCYFLHPRAKGWFEQGELESRRDLGHKYDISLRHVTPYTPYGVLDELVPGAAYVTIMRRPVDRFLSLFNFRDELKTKYKVCASDY